jgi:hypothetical protein
VSGVLIERPKTANILDYPKNKRTAKLSSKGLNDMALNSLVYEDHNLGMGHEQGKIPDIIAQGKADMAFLRDN